MSLAVFLAIDVRETLSLDPEGDNLAGGKPEIGGGDPKMDQIGDLLIGEDDAIISILLVLPIMAVGAAVGRAYLPFGNRHKEDGGRQLEALGDVKPGLACLPPGNEQVHAHSGPLRDEQGHREIEVRKRQVLFHTLDGGNRDLEEVSHHLPHHLGIGQRRGRRRQLGAYRGRERETEDQEAPQRQDQKGFPFSHRNSSLWLLLNGNGMPIIWPQILPERWSS
jgi:hypothetical protein